MQRYKDHQVTRRKEDSTLDKVVLSIVFVGQIAILLAVLYIGD